MVPAPLVQIRRARNQPKTGSEDQWHCRETALPRYTGCTVKDAQHRLGPGPWQSQARRRIEEATMNREVKHRMGRSVGVPPEWTSVLAVIAHPDDASSGW